MRMFDRIGQMRVAWSEGVWPDAWPEVPDERPGARSKHAADLRQTRRRISPVVHRQRADDDVERPIGERQRGRVADLERRTALVAVPPTVRICSGALDHRRIEVDTGHVETVPAREPDRE